MIFPFVLCSSQLEEELKEDVLVFIENLITVNKDLTTCVSMRNIHVHIFSIRMKILIWQKSIFFFIIFILSLKRKISCACKNYSSTYFTLDTQFVFFESIFGVLKLSPSFSQGLRNVGSPDVTGANLNLNLKRKNEGKVSIPGMLTGCNAMPRLY